MKFLITSHLKCNYSIIWKKTKNKQTNKLISTDLIWTPSQKIIHKVWLVAMNGYIKLTRNKTYWKIQTEFFNSFSFPIFSICVWGYFLLKHCINTYGKKISRFGLSDSLKKNFCLVRLNSKIKLTGIPWQILMDSMCKNIEHTY